MATILEKLLAASSNPNSIKIKNRENTEKIIAGIQMKGPQALQVITDFDMTLTRYHLEGSRCHSSYGVLDYSPLMSEEFKTKAHSLFSKYYPIEIDHEFTIAEKIPHMEEWYRGSNENIVSQNIHKSLLKQMVANSRAILRDNAVETMKILYEANIPVLVFSAGVGDVVEEILHKFEVFHPNVHVISNKMIYDEEEKVVGFKEPVIHMYNKNVAVLGETGYFEDIAHKTSAILLGDSLGDTHMSTGIPNLGAILKIGFLNIKIEESMSSFMDHFDIVLVDDQSMDFLNMLLSLLIHQK